MGCLFWMVPVSGVAFRDGLLSLGTVHSRRSVSVRACVQVWLAHVVFILSSIGGHWGAFHEMGCLAI